MPTDEPKAHYKITLQNFQLLQANQMKNWNPQHSLHHKRSSAASVSLHDVVHNKDFHHDESKSNRPRAPCKHNKQNSQDASKRANRDVVQKQQCHRRKVVRRTVMKWKKKKKNELWKMVEIFEEEKNEKNFIFKKQTNEFCNKIKEK